MAVSTVALHAIPPALPVCGFNIASCSSAKPCCVKFSSSCGGDVSVLYAPVLCCSHSCLITRSTSRNFNTSCFFVRRALGYCIEYGSLGLEVDSADELTTINSDDSFVYAKKLLGDAQLRHRIFFDRLVVQAFYEAEKAHRGQMRATGDPYLQHCVETGMLLALVGASSTVVAAGLLHDTLDDSFMNYDYIFRTFGAGVADLVEGVSKLSQLSELARQNGTANKSDEADRLHTMFLAMEDASAVLIKLADRLHNMKTLDALPIVKRQRFAKETLEVFVPLANRLGISRWKEQLEDICFRHLNEEQHEALSSKLVDSFDDAIITSAVVELEQALKERAISYHCVSGRHKSLYSIYRKILKKKLKVDEIHDIHGLRVIVDNERDCYKALEVVHHLWSPVPEKFKDYITQPKFNGYQSLHTVVMNEGTVPVEVQIRTTDMHLQAEFGIAAHWRYKEGDSKHSSFVLQMVEWARWVVTWQCEAMKKVHPVLGLSGSLKPPCTFSAHADDFPDSYNSHCGVEGPVFIILIDNNKMSVQELPANSSIMDMLERAGRDSSSWIPYGYPVKDDFRAKLNHKPVRDPSYKLKMGDIVELSPALPEKSLTEYREEIQRMYDKGLTIPCTSSRA